MIDGILALMVSFVIDGDTFIAHDVAGHEHRIRLWGLDAPELKDRGGDQSRRFLQRLIDNSSENVTCYVIGYDNYDRTVARCVDDNFIDLACVMIETGHAEEWFYFSDGYYQRRGCIYDR